MKGTVHLPEGTRGVRPGRVGRVRVGAGVRSRESRPKVRVLRSRSRRSTWVLSPRVQNKEPGPPDPPSGTKPRGEGKASRAGRRESERDRSDDGGEGREVGVQDPRGLWAEEGTGGVVGAKTEEG